MKFELIPAYNIPLAEQAQIFNRAFKGYIAGWAEMDEAALARFISMQGADPCYSRFVSVRSGVGGFGYINRTGDISRLSGMGMVPEARRTGASSWLLGNLLREAKERGETSMVLEVFEQNDYAVKLYRAAGFETVSRLFGWRRAPRPIDQKPISFQEISQTLASQLPNFIEFPAIPWQISRHAVAKLAVAHAFKAGDVTVVVGDTETKTIRVHACVAPKIDWPAARDAFSFVIARFSDHEFFAPAIFPEEYGTELFEPLGFLREPLNQLLMKRDL